jgi:hypothetical protein
MLVGAATLQGMHLTIPETLVFLSSQGSEIRREKQHPQIPLTPLADELAEELGTPEMDRWWLDSEGLSKPDAATWTYCGSDKAVTTLVRERSSNRPHLLRGLTYLAFTTYSAGGFSSEFHISIVTGKTRN